MKGKDFLSVADLPSDGVAQLVERAYKMKRGKGERPLAGKEFALIFEKPSLRTRVSFEVGIRQLGGTCTYLSQQDVGLGVREPEADIARVLDRWVDGIIARVFSHRSLELLAEYANIPVVNALSDLEHPCQAMGDLLTIREHKGSLSDKNYRLHWRRQQCRRQPRARLCIRGRELHAGIAGRIPDTHERAR